MTTSDNEIEDKVENGEAAGASPVANDDIEDKNTEVRRRCTGCVFCKSFIIILLVNLHCSPPLSHPLPLIILQHHQHTALLSTREQQQWQTRKVLPTLHRNLHRSHRTPPPLLQIRLVPSQIHLHGHQRYSICIRGAIDSGVDICRVDG